MIALGIVLAVLILAVPPNPGNREAQIGELITGIN
jgi:hypothetical protein